MVKKDLIMVLHGRGEETSACVVRGKISLKRGERVDRLTPIYVEDIQDCGGCLPSQVKANLPYNSKVGSIQKLLTTVGYQSFNRGYSVSFGINAIAPKNPRLGPSPNCW